MFFLFNLLPVIFCNPSTLEVLLVPPTDPFPQVQAEIARYNANLDNEISSLLGKNFSAAQENNPQVDVKLINLPNSPGSSVKAMVDEYEEHRISNEISLLKKILSKQTFSQNSIENPMIRVGAKSSYPKVVDLLLRSTVEQFGKEQKLLQKLKKMSSLAQLNKNDPIKLNVYPPVQTDEEIIYDIRNLDHEASQIEAKISADFGL